VPEKLYDLAVIGGGVNGCGIARDAAGRGLSVFLCEQGDLAGATSSASTKLIHGGLRYLEYYEFSLVRKSLQEREVLLRAAPHIIWPLRFVLPHHKGLRPAWFIRLGLFVYDHLGGRKLLPGTRVIDLTRDPAGAPLKPLYKKAFEYSDCWVEDSRLVILNAMDAAARGAEIRVGHRCIDARRQDDRRQDGHWSLTVENRETGGREAIGARGIVNAAGPWAEQFVRERLHFETPARVRLVKGSHVIVPRLFDHDRAYLFQNTDQRIIFAIPYEQDFTLVGTTDVDYPGDPADAAITDDEIGYLCRSAGEYFTAAITPEDVISTFSGVRPLYDDGSKSAQSITRDYVLKLDAPGNRLPLLNIFGGKLTTYRTLSEQVLHALRPFYPAMGGPWTRDKPLPGGDFPVGGSADLVASLRQDCPALSEPHARRLIRAYGTRAWTVIAGIHKLDDLGDPFGADLYACEVSYLMVHEWARTAADLLWRRSKLGLRLSGAEAERLDAWMRTHRRAIP